MIVYVLLSDLQLWLSMLVRSHPFATNSPQPVYIFSSSFGIQLRYSQSGCCGCRVDSLLSHDEGGCAFCYRHVSHRYRLHEQEEGENRRRRHKEVATRSVRRR